MLKVLVTGFHDQFPDFTVLAKVTLILPASSAPCEGVFSSKCHKEQSEEPTDPERLNRLMFVKLVGPSIEKCNFIAAAKAFSALKNRLH